MASNGEESEFFYGIKNNASIVNASPTLIVSKNADGTYEHTLPGSIPLTSAQITTALGYAPIGANTSMTGLTEGALITINTDTAKFNVSAGTGFIVNGDLAVPTNTPVTINASTANIIPNLATQEVTYVSIAANGDLFLTNQQLTATERRSYIRLGRIVHSNNTSINAIYNQPTVNKEVGGQVQDILEFLGFRSASGNRVFPVSTNLKIKKEVGRVFKSGSNFATLATQPHSFILPELDPITFKYRTQTGVEGASVTDIDPDIYDVNGTITPVGSTATLATIQRIFVSQSNEVRIQPGQRVFTTLNGAVTAINSDVFVTDSDIFDNFLYLGAIVLTRNTVNLADIAQAIFVPSIGVCANGAAPVPALGYTAEDAANKQNSLAADGTGAKYPTVDTVNGALALKADLVGGLVPQSQLPSYVDDVLEFSNLAAFPATGEIGKIYIALDSNKQYRWTGSAYLQITNGLIASTNDVPEGSNNLYFTAARVLANVLTGLSTASNAVISATDTVLLAFGKLQAQINGKAPSSGSANYIQNGTAQQTAALNISGTGFFGSSVTASTFQTSANYFSTRLSNISGVGIYGGNSFTLRNGIAGAESLNLDVFNRVTSTWYTPLTLANSGGAATFFSLVGTGTRNVQALADGTLIAVVSSTSSGNYTPTTSNGNNVTSVSPSSHTFTKVGDIVTVYGTANVNVTNTSTTSIFTITLPVARANANGLNMGFGLSLSGTNQLTINSTSSTSTNLTFFATTTGFISTTYSFQYNVTQ